MNLCADIYVPADHFALGRQLTSGCTRIEFMRVVPIEGKLATYLWVADTDEAGRSFQATIGESDRCRSATPICERNDTWLYRIEWADGSDQFFETIRDCDITVRRAVGTSDRWMFRLLAADRADLAAFRQRCAEQTIPFTLERLREPVTPAEQVGVTLTDAQQEALGIALRDGYFDVPRASTLEDIGEQLGISHKAASLRLRRGLKRVVETLYEDGSIRERQQRMRTR